jgi:hypothetical protein
MFRQHADLYQQHAAILERISASPNSIQAWQLEEPCPERVAAQVNEEETTTLALKGYESMLQVQRRVNHVERLVKRSGVGVKTCVRQRSRMHGAMLETHIDLCFATLRICQSRKTTKKELRIQEKEDPSSALFWFFKQHALRISQDLQQPLESSQVRKEVVRIWKIMNPVERRPFVDKAERVQKLKRNDANESGKVSAVAAAKRYVLNVSHTRQVAHDVQSSFRAPPSHIACFGNRSKSAKPKKAPIQESKSDSCSPSSSSSLSSSSSDDDDDDDDEEQEEDRLLFQRRRRRRRRRQQVEEADLSSSGDSESSDDKE